MQASVSVVLQTFQLHAVEMSNQPLLPVLELFVDCSICGLLPVLEAIRTGVGLGLGPRLHSCHGKMDPPNWFPPEPIC